MSYSELTEQEKRECLLEDARREKGRLKAMKEIIKTNDDCEAILIIDGLKHAFSHSGLFMGAINAEMRQISNAERGIPNKWE
jgi:hypothetical protein